MSTDPLNELPLVDQKMPLTNVEFVALSAVIRAEKETFAKKKRVITEVLSGIMSTVLKENHVIKGISDKFTDQASDIIRIITDNKQDYDEKISQIGRYFLALKINDNSVAFLKNMNDLKEESLNESIRQVFAAMAAGLSDEIKDDIGMNEDGEKFKIEMEPLIRESVEGVFTQAFDVFTQFHNTIPEIVKNEKLTNHEKTDKITNLLI